MSTDDERISSLYHQADKPTPPGSLDDTILSASRDAVKKPAATRGPFSSGWPAAASIAAVIVITIILVPVLKQQEQAQSPPAPQRQLGSTAEKTEPAPPKTTEARKKSAGAFTPAGEPALLQEEVFSADQAQPSAATIGAGVASEPESELDYLLEAEEIPAGRAISNGRARMQAVDSAPMAIFTPEMWEAKITQLIDNGDIEQARTEVAKLRQRYPDYSISAEILKALN